jgi:hypothetical protein
LHIHPGFSRSLTVALLVASVLMVAPARPAGAVVSDPVTLSGSSSFPATLVGVTAEPQPILITNNTNSPVTVSGLHLIDGAILDFFGSANCAKPDLTFAPIPAHGTCTLSTSFLPGALGVRSTTLRVDETSLGLHQLLTISGTGVEGYYVAATSGQVAAEGSAPNLGDVSHAGLHAPIVGSAIDGSGGYWLVASDGGIFSFGDAGFYGSTGAVRLNRPIVGMAATPSGLGYWLVASDGGIFTFGDAAFFGSTGAIGLARPIVGMAPTPTRGGYWLVASDGGVFAFGDAPFLGSLGGQGAYDIIGIASASPAIPDYLVDAPLAAGMRALALTARP